MDIDTVALTLARLEGETKAIRELFSSHTEQDMTQFSALSSALETIDGKMDDLLIREATREGKAIGIRRSSVFIAGGVSFFISGAGLVLRYVS